MGSSGRTLRLWSRTLEGDSLHLSAPASISHPFLSPFPYFMNIPSDICSHHYFLLTQAEVKPIGLNLRFEPINYELSSKLFLFINYLRYFIIVIRSSLYTTPRLLVAGISTSSPAGLQQGTNQGDRNKEQR